MSDFDFSKVASVLSLSFETELCEALDWDSEKTEVFRHGYTSHERIL